MNEYSFTFAGQPLVALADKALWWPSEGLLAVSDLHLAKSDRMARRTGTLAPPYETRDTLARLDSLIERLQPSIVLSLGDAFDDMQAAHDLPEEETLWLTRMMAGREWVWVTGNHDPAPIPFPGTQLAQWARHGLTFRHIAEPNGNAEISGHYHPKIGLGPQGHRGARACFLIDETRLILPAFGTYTGGLYADAPELQTLLGPRALAVQCGPHMRLIPAKRQRS